MTTNHTKQIHSQPPTEPIISLVTNTTYRNTDNNILHTYIRDMKLKYCPVFSLAKLATNVMSPHIVKSYFNKFCGSLDIVCVSK